MEDFIKTVVLFAIIGLIIFGVHGCSKKIGLVQPDECIEMSFTTIDDEIIIGKERDIYRLYSKLYYSDNNRVVEVKEIICTKYGYWYEK